MGTVLVTGGSGVIGRRLCKKLRERGFDVAILSRTDKQEAGVKVYTWDIGTKKIDKRVIETADYIIHLAGVNIGDKKWSEPRKQLIISSRVDSAQLIFEKIKELKSPVKAFISASGINYYGTVTSDKVFVETDLPAGDFLGKTCWLWEEAADQFKEIGIRTVKIRTAGVLATEGGLLPKMMTPAKFGLGAPLGSGKQYMPWIHIDDLCEIYIKAITDPRMEGPYNAAAPDSATNKEFIRTLARLLHKPFWLPNVPASVIKLVFGEMAGIILKGSRVSSEKIIAAGFNFKYRDLESALKDLIVVAN